MGWIYFKKIIDVLCGIIRLFCDYNSIGICVDRIWEIIFRIIFDYILNGGISFEGIVYIFIMVDVR